MTLEAEPISFFSLSWVSDPADSAAKMYITEETAIEILKEFPTYKDKEKETWAYILRESNNRISMVYSFRMLILDSITRTIKKDSKEGLGIVRDIIDLRKQKGFIETFPVYQENNDSLNDIRYKSYKHFYRKLKKILCADPKNLPCKINEKDPILQAVVRLRLS